MEFASESEFITSLILIPIFSTALFLLISFLEIFEKYEEILFLNKKHTYTNKDLILPLIIAVFFGLVFYAFYFHLTDYLNSFPPLELPPQPCAEFSGINNISNYNVCIDDYKEKHRIPTLWDLFRLLTF